MAFFETRLFLRGKIKSIQIKCCIKSCTCTQVILLRCEARWLLHVAFAAHVQHASCRHPWRLREYWPYARAGVNRPFPVRLEFDMLCYPLPLHCSAAGTFEDVVDLVGNVHKMIGVPTWVVQGTGDEVCPETYVRHDACDVLPTHPAFPVMFCPRILLSLLYSGPELGRFKPYVMVNNNHI